MNRKTTQQEFERFKAAFTGYMRLFGLTDYRIFFKHGCEDGTYAQVERDEMGKCCTAKMCATLDREAAEHWGESGPEQSAKHEAIHMMLLSLISIGCARWSSQDEMKIAEEGLVRRLEKLIPDLEEKCCPKPGKK